MRLIAEGKRVDGMYRIGIAITMTSGSHTYWKQPGDAGVPPVFAFNGSANVTDATVLFPVPTRIKEDGLEAFGYTNTVVFPVVVTLADPNKPSTLHVDMTYAVCNKICVPAKTVADLELPPDASTADDKGVAAAFGTVPTSLRADEHGDLTLQRVPGAAKPTWTITWSGKTPIEDVFADAPEGYAFDTRKASTPKTWTLIASQVVTAPTANRVPVSLTLAGKIGGLTTIETLDVSPAAP